MKITIDEKVCQKHKIGLKEVIIALALRDCEDTTLENMLARGIIFKHNDRYILTEPWKEVLDKILSESDNTISEEDRITNLAKEMQKYFPQGKMPGTPYYYRCNVAEVSKKLKRFFEQYGDFSDEDILDATKRYIDSHHGNYKYLPLIKYFITKNKKVEDEDGIVKVVEYSPLMDYLENKEQEQEDNTAEMEAPDDWMLNTRN